MSHSLFSIHEAIFVVLTPAAGPPPPSLPPQLTPPPNSAAHYDSTTNTRREELDAAGAKAQDLIMSIDPTIHPNLIHPD